MRWHHAFQEVAAWAAERAALVQRCQQLEHQLSLPRTGTLAPSSSFAPRQNHPAPLPPRHDDMRPRGADMAVQNFTAPSLPGHADAGEWLAVINQGSLVHGTAVASPLVATEAALAGKHGAPGVQSYEGGGGGGSLGAVSGVSEQQQPVRSRVVVEEQCDWARLMSHTSVIARHLGTGSSTADVTTPAGYGGCSPSKGPTPTCAPSELHGMQASSGTGAAAAAAQPQGLPRLKLQPIFAPEGEGDVAQHHSSALTMEAVGRAALSSPVLGVVSPVAVWDEGDGEVGAVDLEQPPGFVTGEAVAAGEEREGAQRMGYGSQGAVLGGGMDMGGQDAGAAAAMFASGGGADRGSCDEVAIVVGPDGSLMASFSTQQQLMAAAGGLLLAHSTPSFRRTRTVSSDGMGGPHLGGSTGSRGRRSSTNLVNALTLATDEVMGPLADLAATNPGLRRSLRRGTTSSVLSSYDGRSRTELVLCDNALWDMPPSPITGPARGSYSGAGGSSLSRRAASGMPAFVRITSNGAEVPARDAVARFVATPVAPSLFALMAAGAAAGGRAQQLMAAAVGGPTEAGLVEEGV